MKKTWIDIVFLISIVMCFSTGYVMDFHIASSRQMHQIFKEIHLWSAYCMTITLLFHIKGRLFWFKSRFGKNKESMKRYKM